MSSSNRGGGGEERGAEEGAEDGGGAGGGGRLQPHKRRLKPHHQRLQLFKEGGKCTLAPFSEITEAHIDKENPIDPYFL